MTAKYCTLCGGLITHGRAKRYEENLNRIRQEILMGYAKAQAQLETQATPATAIDLASQQHSQILKSRKHARFKGFTYKSQMLENLKMQLDVIEKRSTIDFEDATDIMMQAIENDGKYPAWAFERLNDLYNRYCT